MAEPLGEIRLQVLVCTFGEEGIKRFAATHPPMVAGVEYLVSWQLPDGIQTPVPEELASRRDIKITKSYSRGLSVNRNLAMLMATAPLCLIADDDIDYADGSSFTKIIDTFSQTDADVICFKSTSCGKPLKPYTTRLLPHSQAPKGWYVTSFEIAYRRDSVAGQTAFDTDFGIGATTGMWAGEEEVWIRDVQLRGGKVMLSPECICDHDHPSTAERHAAEDWFIRTHGVVMRHLHPASYPLRLLVHAFRQRDISVARYLRLAFSKHKL